MSRPRPQGPPAYRQAFLDAWQVSQAARNYHPAIPLTSMERMDYIERAVSRWRMALGFAATDPQRAEVLAHLVADASYLVHRGLELREEALHRARLANTA